MAIFEALIGGATTLLGGLFGKKKQKTETTIDYVKMAREAQKAGFNPLTALRNGGSAGFTSTVHHPGLSGVADAVGQIGGALGAALDQRTDPIEQKRGRVESALLDYQLATIQNRAKAPMMFGDVPTKSATGRVTQHAAPMGAKRVVAPVTNIVPGDAPTVSSVGLEDRFGVVSDPGTADAAVWEQRYGEPGSWIGGLYVGAADAVKWAQRKMEEADKRWTVDSNRLPPKRSALARPQSKHQADPGSWLDFAPKTTW